MHSTFHPRPRCGVLRGESEPEPQLSPAFGHSLDPYHPPPPHPENTGNLTLQSRYPPGTPSCHAGHRRRASDATRWCGRQKEKESSCGACLFGRRRPSPVDWGGRAAILNVSTVAKGPPTPLPSDSVRLASHVSLSPVVPDSAPRFRAKLYDWW